MDIRVVDFTAIYDENGRKFPLRIFSYITDGLICSGDFKDDTVFPEVLLTFIVEEAYQTTEFYSTYSDKIESKTFIDLYIFGESNDYIKENCACIETDIVRNRIYKRGQRSINI